MSAFKCIALIGSHENPLVAQTIEHLMTLLKGWGLPFWVDENAATRLSIQPEQTGSLSTLAKHCDLAIVVGGDGNLLSAARTLSLHDVPLIGVNRGKLGFLTELCPDNLEDSLPVMLDGNFIKEKRFLLEGELRHEGKVLHAGNALNDIVLFIGAVAKLFEFDIQINGQHVCRQRSDGVILSTPTGSTAYSLSAGGPLLEPELEAVLICPLCPHTLTHRPIVVDAKHEIRLHISSQCNSEPRVSFDGQEHYSVSPGDEVIIRKQEKLVTLLQPKAHNYYAVLRDKLHWNTQPA